MIVLTRCNCSVRHVIIFIIFTLQYCAKLKAVAAKLKIKAAKVDQAVREAVLKGYLTTSAVVKSVREFFENEVLSKKCEDFLPDAVSIFASKNHCNISIADISL